VIFLTIGPARAGIPFTAGKHFSNRNCRDRAFIKMRAIRSIWMQTPFGIVRLPNPGERDE